VHAHTCADRLRTRHTCARVCAQIREIDMALGLPPSHDLWEPTLDRAEWPELR
jgi:hypothetical protein